MKKQLKTDVLWMISFLAGFVFILYKCRYGFANVDESFYLTIPYRFWQGDIMCVDEWNISQISALMMLPIFKLYMYFAGTTEGILLAFRYLFSVFQACISAFIYWKLRKINWGAGFASIQYLLLAPFGIMALSYNSMGVGLTVIGFILLYCNRNKNGCEAFFAGLAFAGAVLCCPHLILVYVIYGMGCAVNQLWVKRHNCAEVILGWKVFLWFTAGCGIAAVVFLIYLFQRCSFRQFFEILPMILDDPNHGNKGLLQVIYSFLRNIVGSHVLSFETFLCAGILAIVILRDKKRRQHERWYFLGAAALTAIYTVPFLVANVWINHMMFPMAILGCFCFLLRGEQFRREMIFLWLPGLLYGFCINWASTTGFRAIADAATVSSIGSILMAVECCNNLSLPESRTHFRKTFQAGFACFLSVFIACTAFVRYNALFWELGTMADMTHEITVGVQKGLVTSEQQGQWYEQLYHDTEPVRNDEAEKVLYFSESSWLYLEDTKQNCSYSGWVGYEYDQTADKLVAYYTYNPAKLPDIVFSLKEYWPQEPLTSFLEEQGYQLEETERAFILKKS